MDLFERFEAVVLSTEDLAKCRAFYESVFSASWIYEDDVSAMFELGPVVFVLLERGAASQLTRPLLPGRDGENPRTVFTLRVSSADATCSDLAQKGVTILDGPTNREWGRRTATFSDPAGHIWEIAEVL